ncbi:hypothetical protein [Stutzerimonas stutzeri]|uniref:hypothetical protein n=1 Tax=Stutzerimonas stutzeri TaxID=316 RepID=UPI00210C5695|nr:hypothetical protein [Stutzerimonas stutzeri]MCQ4241909.1 hypothetical protein [Stutzerimonas stutzeri]
MKSRSVSLEDECRKLRSDLYMARTTILQLMPEAVQEAVKGYISCKSHDDVWQWKRGAIENILLLAQSKPAKEMDEYASSTDRAYCPLCGGSAQTIYGGKGFAFPDGLRRHLEGSYNSHQCSVFEAIQGLGREHAKV